MSTITIEEYTAWKRKVQKLMKESGHSLTYSKDKLSDIMIYPNVDKTGKPIRVVFRPSHKMPYLHFQMKKINSGENLDISKTEAMSILITEAKKFINEYCLTENMKLEVSFDKWQIDSKIFKEISEWLLELGFSRVGNQNAYYDLSTSAFQLKLYELNKELDEMSPIPEFKRNFPSLSQIQFNGNSQEGIEIDLRGEVDRRVWVQVVYDEREYRIKFESTHHSKEIRTKEISSNVLANEWDQYKKEEAFKILYEGPKMNKAIREALHSLAKRFSHTSRIGVQDVFERFLEKMEFEEMALMAEHYRKNSIIELRSIEIVDSEKEMNAMARNNNVFNAKVLLFWGKYIVATRMRKFEKVDSSCHDVEEFRILEDENEAVLSMKTWLIENSFD